MNRTTGRFICFKCSGDSGFRGAPEWALIEMTDLGIPQLRKHLYGAGRVVAGFLDLDFGDFGPEAEDETEIIRTDILKEMVRPYNHYDLDHKFSANGVRYLLRRQIPIDIAIKYEIRYNPETRSVVFPVYVGPTLVGWQERIIDKEVEVSDEGEVFRKIKIRSSHDIPRSRVVMFQNRLNGSKSCVLTEGPVDAIKAHLVGGNVASMGKTINTGQIQAILRSGIKTLYLALDPDASSVIQPLIHKFGDDIVFRRVKIPAPFKDLGDMPLDLATSTILNSDRIYRGQIELWFRPLGRK